MLQLDTACSLAALCELAICRQGLFANSFVFAMDWSTDVAKHGPLGGVAAQIERSCSIHISLSYCMLIITVTRGWKKPKRPISKTHWFCATLEKVQGKQATKLSHVEKKKLASRHHAPLLRNTLLACSRWEPELWTPSNFDSCSDSGPRLFDHALFLFSSAALAIWWEWFSDIALSFCMNH